MALPTSKKKKKNRNYTLKMGLANALAKLVDHREMQSVLIRQFALDPNTGWEFVRCISDMEIYDEELWIVYKYHCNQDWDWFIASILTKDKMIDKTITKYKGRV